MADGRGRYSLAAEEERPRASFLVELVATLGWPSGKSESALSLKVRCGDFQHKLL